MFNYLVVNKTSEILGIADEMKNFLSGSYSDLQASIYLKNRINEIGGMVNTFFYAGSSDEVTNLNEKLLEILHALKDVSNQIPNSLPRIQSLLSALIHFILINYSYTSTNEETQLNSIALSLSTFLIGLPDPIELWPEENFEALPMDDIVTAIRVYDSTQNLYHTLFTNSVAESRDTLRSWGRKYLELDSKLVKLDMLVNQRYADERSLDRLISHFDAVVARAVYLAAFTHSQLRITGGGTDLQDFTGMTKTGLLEMLNGRIHTAKSFWESIQEKIASGQVNRNDRLWEQPQTVFANFGMAYTEVMLAHLEAASFDGIKNVEGVYGQYKTLFEELRSVHEKLGIPMDRSPYAPVSMSILTTVNLLAVLSGREITREFTEVSKSTAAFNLTMATLDPESYSEDLEEYFRVFDNSRAACQILKHLMRVSTGEASYEDLLTEVGRLIKEVEGFGNSALAEILKSYLAYLKNRGSISWAVNHYDLRTVARTEIEAAGHRIVLYPFLADSATRMNTYPAIHVDLP